jgi:hypothetical protein
VPLHIQNNYLKGAAIMLTFICFFAFGVHH